MLTIGKLGRSVDQLAYYEQQVAYGIEDYLSGRGEALGRWMGRGCGGIGLCGQIDRAGFMRAMAGCDPRTGERLRPDHSQTKLAAFDLTFSAPKSVSVLFAIADEQTAAALVDAHERAVEAALGYVEREACCTRRGRNGVRRLRGEGFVAAAYRHRLSRAGDPQLHTHMVVANMTRAEGRWTTLDAHSLYEHVSAGGAVYRAVLRAEVRERLPWVSWRSVGRGLFEIDGVPSGVLREFSRRRVEIEERARELTGVAAGELSRERLQGIALATRRAKEYGVDGARCPAEARARAAEQGLGLRELERLCGRSAAVADRPEADIVRAVAERLSGPDGLTSQHNTFARRHALAEIAGDFAQGASVVQLERAMSGYLQHRSVVALGVVEGERRCSTRGLLACEEAILDGAVRRRSKRVGVLAPALADRVGVDRFEGLSEEQMAAVQHVIAEGCGVSVLQALAGTGKTRVLGALAGIYEAGGYWVLGAAPTGRAARELADAAGIRATTIHRLVSDLDGSDGLGRQTVILLDEAGTAPTRPSAALFAQAERAGAKVVAVGDSGQLPSVAAGGWFAAVTSRLDGPELRRVMRQRDPAEREALAALHDGDPDAYLAHKQARETLVVHEREDDAVEATLADWNAARREHGLSGAVMIARENATRSILNERARALLIAEGSLSVDGVLIADRELRIGDRVIARRNDRHRDVDNGTLARIVAIEADTGELTIITDSGRRCVLDAAYAAEHLEPAYALTGHGAQGATVEWAGVIGRPSEFGREWAYTALSRARGGTRMHLIAEATPKQRERGHYTPPEPDRTVEEALNSLRSAMRRSEREALAAEHLEPITLPGGEGTAARALPLTELSEAGAQRAVLDSQPRSAAPARPPEPGWMALRRQRERLARGRASGDSSGRADSRPEGRYGSCSSNVHRPAAPDTQARLPSTHRGLTHADVSDLELAWSHGSLGGRER